METALPVTLILDLDFDDPLTPLLEVSDVWMVQSPQSSKASQQLKDGSALSKLPGSLSTFAPEGNSVQRWLYDAIDLADQHHDEYAQTLPYTSLRVIGAKATPHITELLAEFGFGNIKETPDGFVANKLAATS